MVATHALNVVGGTETYLATVADNLVRLGHEVVVHAGHLGPMSDVVRASGAAVVLADGLPTSADALLVNEVSMSYALAQRYPGQPQVFVAHSPLYDGQVAPLLPVPGSVVVAMNDRLADRAHALAADLEVVRLRQPIDSTRLAPRGAPHPTPRRALLLGNYLRGPALAAIEQAWGTAGIEVVQVGHLTTPTYDVASAVAGVDIVVGKARAVLDGMSCGRAAFVYDAFGGDGWVTPQTYDRLEADGFAGQSGGEVFDVAALGAALERYDAAMGHANRELVLTHHQDRKHAEALVRLFERLVEAPRTPVTHSGELARLAALRWKAEMETVRLRRDVETLTERVRRLEVDLAVTEQRRRRRARAARRAERRLAMLTGEQP